MSLLRANGRREPTTRELKVIKRLWVGGHTDKQIGDMVGRTTRSVHGIRTRQGWTESGAELRANAWFSAAEEAQINKRIIGWIEIERLSCAQMAARLALLHPPGLHLATVHKRIRSLGGQLYSAHRQNMKGRKSRRTERMHKNGGAKTQPRVSGKFAKKEVGEDALQHTESHSV